MILRQMSVASALALPIEADQLVQRGLLRRKLLRVARVIAQRLGVR